MSLTCCTILESQCSVSIEAASFITVLLHASKTNYNIVVTVIIFSIILSSSPLNKEKGMYHSSTDP